MTAGFLPTLFWFGNEINSFSQFKTKQNQDVVSLNMLLTLSFIISWSDPSAALLVESNGESFCITTNKSSKCKMCLKIGSSGGSKRSPKRGGRSVKNFHLLHRIFPWKMKLFNLRSTPSCWWGCKSPTQSIQSSPYNEGNIERRKKKNDKLWHRIPRTQMWT